MSERGGWSISPLPEAHLMPDAVVAFVDGELSASAFDRASAHIARCPLCAAETTEQRQARDAVAAAEAPRMPAGLLAALRAIPTDTDRLVDDGPSPEEVYSDTHLDPDLQQALDELAPEFRAAVVLCDVEGLSYEEIGATLGVKLGTVRSRIHRGRQALRLSLERRRELAEEGAG